MSDVDPKELIGKVEDNDLRTQLEAVFGELSGSALRQQVTTLQDENKHLKITVRNHAFRDAGFDPESGPGKALAKLYEGEPDPEQIKQVATEYGLNPNAGDGTTQQASAAEERQAGEDRTAQLNQGSTAPRDPSVDDQIKQAEAAGDWATFNRLSAQKLEAARRS